MTTLTEKLTQLKEKLESLSSKSISSTLNELNINLNTIDKYISKEDGSSSIDIKEKDEFLDKMDAVKIEKEFEKIVFTKDFDKIFIKIGEENIDKSIEALLSSLKDILNKTSLDILYNSNNTFITNIFDEIDEFIKIIEANKENIDEIYWNITKIIDKNSGATMEIDFNTNLYDLIDNVVYNEKQPDVVVLKGERLLQYKIKNIDEQLEKINENIMIKLSTTKNKDEALKIIDENITKLNEPFSEYDDVKKTHDESLKKYNEEKSNIENINNPIKEKESRINEVIEGVNNGSYNLIFHAGIDEQKKKYEEIIKLFIHEFNITFNRTTYIKIRAEILDLIKYKEPLGASKKEKDAEIKKKLLEYLNNKIKHYNIKAVENERIINKINDNIKKLNVWKNETINNIRDRYKIDNNEMFDLLSREIELMKKYKEIIEKVGYDKFMETIILKSETIKKFYSEMSKLNNEKKEIDNLYEEYDSRSSKKISFDEYYTMIKKEKIDEKKKKYFRFINSIAKDINKIFEGTSKLGKITLEKFGLIESSRGEIDFVLLGGNLEKITEEHVNHFKKLLELKDKIYKLLIIIDDIKKKLSYIKNNYSKIVEHKINEYLYDFCLYNFEFNNTKITKTKQTLSYNEIDDIMYYFKLLTDTKYIKDNYDKFRPDEKKIVMYYQEVMKKGILILEKIQNYMKSKNYIDKYYYNVYISNDVIMNLQMVIYIYNKIKS
jgi:predicted SpoU family rRNA methylase